MEVPSRASGIEHGTLRRIVMLNHRTTLTAEAQEQSGVRHGLRTLRRIVNMSDRRGVEYHCASVTALQVGFSRGGTRDG